MNLIQNYKDLNILETIIFWGIILLIVLVIILAVILIVKKKTRKKEINDSYEELPIVVDKIKPEESTEEIFESKPIETIQEPEFSIEDIWSITPTNNVETEVATVDQNNIEEVAAEPIKEETIPEIKLEENKYNTTFEMPSAPYQRNVLREMSLSQTSPIGINRRQDDYSKKEEIIKEPEHNIIVPIVEEIEIPDDQPLFAQAIEKPIEDHKKITEEIIETPYEPEQEETLTYNEEETSNNDGFDDDIERTSYEIEQEENAIISYKELMEKKDSIQTIDEEEAIISIEELLNKASKDNKKEEESKLYNISEEEENDSFINELKQFRKDL